MESHMKPPTLQIFALVGEWMPRVYTKIALNTNFINHIHDKDEQI
jgi:hypothetical protein